MSIENNDDKKVEYMIFILYKVHKVFQVRPFMEVRFPFNATRFTRIVDEHILRDELYMLQKLFIRFTSFSPVFLMFY